MRHLNPHCRQELLHQFSLLDRVTYEIELTRISFEADVCDVCKTVAAVLHGLDLLDPPQDLQPSHVRASGRKQTLEKALYIDPEGDMLRSKIEEQSRLVRARTAKS